MIKLRYTAGGEPRPSEPLELVTSSYEEVGKTLEENAGQTESVIQEDDADESAPEGLSLDGSFEGQLSEQPVVSEPHGEATTPTTTR